MRSRPYPRTFENFGRAPFGRAASSWSHPIDGCIFDEWKWSPPDAARAGRFATSAFMDPPWKAGCVDPVGSFGASVGPDHRETGVVAFHRLSTRAWGQV